VIYESSDVRVAVQALRTEVIDYLECGAAI
jgi:hypothetical protein